jgi:predicted TPR repeat methyltransferase
MTPIEGSRGEGDGAVADDALDAFADADKSWLRVPLTDPTEVAARYDAWASTYEQTLHDWRYDAPTTAARMLGETLAHRNVSILDIGCGTGLTGRALVTQGFTDIAGIDISSVSLDVAESAGAYRHLKLHDFNDGPLPFADDSYGSALCIGVLSYAHEPRALIIEMSRVVASGGVFVFSHRSDLWEEQDFPGMLNDLVSDGLLRKVTWSDPQLYMPGNEDFADQILVHYTVATVA